MRKKINEFIWIESRYGYKYLINISQIIYIEDRDINLSSKNFPIEVTREEIKRIIKYLNILGGEKNEN